MTNNDDDVPVTILTQIINAFELHNEALANQRTSIELLIQENTKINERLAKLEAANSIGSSDAEFLAHITTRLAAISNVVKKAKS